MASSADYNFSREKDMTAKNRLETDEPQGDNHDGEWARNE